MKTFDDFQTAAAQIPASLRNNLDRINFPAMGLQEEASRIGSLLGKASSSGRFELTPDQKVKLQDKLADLLWYTALICSEAGVSMTDVAVHSIAQLQERAKSLDPDQR